MRRKIDDRWLRTTTEQGEWFDVHLPAFGVRIGARRRTWFVSIRDGKKHPSRKKIGVYPAMSLSEARARAREWLSGGPPAPTQFLELAEQFLADGRTRRGRVWRPATTKAYTLALLRKSKVLHRRPVAEIRRRDVAALLRAVAVEPGTTSAAATKAALSRFWGWLVENDYAEGNVVTGTASYAIGVGQRVLSDDELRALWRETATPSAYHAILRLCAWTGCRRSEAAGLRWDELEGDLWRIPGRRTKNGRPLELPLATQTVAYLRQLPRVVGRPYAFGVRSSRGFNDFDRCKAELDRRLQFSAPWSLHDVRRTVQTRLAGLGIAYPVINKILNHGEPALVRAYDHHDYLQEKRAALQLWSNALNKLCTAEK
jgi:integrase